MQIAIIGFGRFGRLLYEILKQDHDVTTFDKDDALNQLDTFDTIFLTVPIREFKTTVQKIAPTLRLHATVIDTCSVKLYPVDCMQAELRNDITIIATHPLFGPDSYYQSQHNNMMTHLVRGDDKKYRDWLHYFLRKNIFITEITPDEHDRYAAYSQGITHLIGRTLQKATITPTPIDTLGFTQLLKITNQTCNDSMDLFTDLQTYNPYTKQAQEAVLQAMKELIKS